MIPRIGGRRLDSIMPADLTTLYAQLLERGGHRDRPLAPKTVRHVHTTLRKALADAVKARHLAYNPAAVAKAPRVPHQREPRAWTASQVRAFLEHVAGNRLEALWILAATTGMRRGEILGLRWLDVDVEAAELHVRQTLVTYGKAVPPTFKDPKSPASRRTIPLGERAVEALKAHAGRQAAEATRAGDAYTDRGLVFCDEIGDPLDPPTASASFKRLVAEAKLPPITFHGLRHTWATIALDAGVDVPYAAEILGHSSPAITQSIYQHTRRDRLTKAVETIGAEIFGN